MVYLMIKELSPSADEVRHSIPVDTIFLRLLHMHVQKWKLTFAYVGANIRLLS